MTDVTRRSTMFGALAAASCLCAPSLARAATLASRRFGIERAGDTVGFQTVELRQAGDTLRVTIEIEIVVRVLGIAAYRYEMQNVEHWDGGRLKDLKSTTNDDGTAQAVSIRRAGDQLEIEGSGYSGRVAGDAATTTYWSYDFLRRPLWISTHDGQPLKVAARRAGTRSVDLAGRVVSAESWTVSGGLDLQLLYAQQEWVANYFIARGEEVRIVAEDTRTPLAPHFIA
ncbi:MAG: DUF6134 family protein [Pseudomonadota bacterium]